MNFSSQYQEYLNDINKEIASIACVPESLQKSVFAAMNYALTGGGKRIRPVLTVAICDMLGGNHQDAIKVASALECIHTYSLIHDDLPCMDDDDMRRGRPTCHKVFPENIALLAGDGLLNLAFELLSDTSRYETLSESVIVKLIAKVSKASGIHGMIGGQVIDLESEGLSNVTEGRLRELHRLKTGALILVSAQCGCICAGILDETNDTFKSISEYASKLGLAFQVKDDILDVIGKEEALGKPIGSDAKSEKNTFVTLLGLDGAKEELEQLTCEAKEALDSFEHTDFLVELADYLLKREC